MFGVDPRAWLAPYHYNHVLSFGAGDGIPCDTFVAQSRLGPLTLERGEVGALSWRHDLEAQCALLWLSRFLCCVERVNTVRFSGLCFWLGSGKNRPWTNTSVGGNF